MSITTNGPTGAGRTFWSQARETPLRRFLRTETGGAAVVLVAALAALAWANIDSPSYAHAWGTMLSLRLGAGGPAHDLRYWVISGLMTLFFFVAGLEVRREFDMGELRDRRRVALPLVAGLGGTVLPIAGFLIFNAGRAS